MADYTAFLAHHTKGDKSFINCTIKEGSLIRYIYVNKISNIFYNGDIYFDYLTFKYTIDKFQQIHNQTESQNTYRVCFDDEEIISCLCGYESRHYKDLIYKMKLISNEFSKDKDFAVIDTREFKEIISLEFLEFVLLKKSKISNRDILDGMWRAQQSARSFSAEGLALGQWNLIKDDNIINTNLDK